MFRYLSYLHFLNFHLSLPFIQLLASKVGCEPDDICDFELQACDTQPSIVAGAMKEFIFSGRLDNLCMSFCSLQVILKFHCDLFVLPESKFISLFLVVCL